MTVILVIHILVSVVLVGVVLMQRSEGGALGVGGGGGGGGGGLMSGRGKAGALVRTTIIFGAIFFVTSLTLTTISSRGSDGMTDIERQLQGESGGDPLDVTNDLSAPLLDDGDPLDTGDTDLSTPSEQPESETTPPASGSETSDPLAADVAPQDDESEEAVDEPQQ